MKDWLAAVAVRIAVPASADDPRDGPDGATLTAVSAGHRLACADGTRQSFQADGGMAFRDRSGARGQGRRGARGDRACPVWPPSDTGARHDVAQAADAVRFTDDAGAATEGRLAAE
jgi:hypothetical protein